MKPLDPYEYWQRKAYEDRLNTRLAFVTVFLLGTMVGVAIKALIDLGV